MTEPTTSAMHLSRRAADLLERDGTKAHLAGTRLSCLPVMPRVTGETSVDCITDEEAICYIQIFVTKNKKGFKVSIKEYEKLCVVRLMNCVYREG